MNINLIPDWLQQWEIENGCEPNHKGSWCVHNPKVFCQEGYCSECNLTKYKKIGYNGGNMIKGKCKAKDLTREITKAWIFHEHGIGEIWTLDEIDKEIMGRN